jgi:hypothetical protein
VSATTISYVEDRIQCKHQDYKVFVLYLTHNAWNCSLKLNKALLSNKFLSITWLQRDLIAFRTFNAANNEIYQVAKLYNRFQISSTVILLTRRNSSVWMTETRVLKTITNLWMWHYRYLLNKMFTKAVGKYDDGIQWDIQPLNVPKPYLTYNAFACCLKVNKKFFCKILSFTFQ